MPYKDIEKRRQYSRERRAKQTPEQRAAYNKQCREYQKANIEKHTAYQREWIAKNRKKKSQYSMKANRLWKERHPEEAKRRARIQYERHYARIKMNNQIRKARIRGAEGSHTKKEWLAKVIEHKWLCFYCKSELTIVTLTKDHLLPIVRGGRDDIYNIVPACISCNSSKQAKTKEEFILSKCWTNQ